MKPHLVNQGVLIICPAYGQQMCAHTSSVLYSIGQQLTRIGIDNQFLWFSMAEIIEARNVFLTLFYDNYPQHDRLLMVDNDMYFNPMMILQMLKLDKPLTGVFYCRREIPKDGDRMSIVVGHELDDAPPQEAVDGFIRVAHVGGGVMMIKREMVTELIKKNPGLVDYEDVGRLSGLGVSRVIRAFDKMKGPKGNTLSEDYSICQRWLDCGGEVWAKIDQPISHIGPMPYSINYLELVQERGGLKVVEEQAA